MLKSRCDVSKKYEKLFFKKIPVTMRSHLHELTGNELKVWMYFHLRSGADATSYPSNKLIAQETGINIETVKLAKAKLRKLGWLEAGDQRKRQMVHSQPWWKKPTYRGWKTQLRITENPSTAPWTEKT